MALMFLSGCIECLFVCLFDLLLSYYFLSRLFHNSQLKKLSNRALYNIYMYVPTYNLHICPPKNRSISTRESASSRLRLRQMLLNECQSPEEGLSDVHQ